MTVMSPSKDSISSNIGFVVIGRNEGNRLIRCLDSLKSQGDFEIVYVDSGSTDQSILEAEHRHAQIVRLDLTRPFTAGRARNEGFAALQARMPDIQFVQFVDGDCELAEGWLACASSFLNERQDVAVVCGRRQEREPDASPYNQLCDIEWNTPIGEADACGGDALVRAAPFSEIGGFSNWLIAGEEPELCLRLRAQGWKIWRLDSAMTTHDAAMYRFAQWWMRSVRSGFGYAQVWYATKDQPLYLYRKELFRAMIWAAFLPLVFIATAGVNPKLGLAMFGIYGIQVARIAIRRGGMKAASWIYGFFTVLAKVPELLGAARFFIHNGREHASQAILYK